jgi:lysophospholipase L1-like esterase
MNKEMVETWVQYTHLEKLYGYLPGMSETIPAVFGLDTATYKEVAARFDQNAKGAAERLLDDPAFGARVDQLPFRTGQTVLAVGDSVTDDLQSWAEILRHLLAIRRPDDHIRVVNGGLTAHTTTMVLRRWPATLAAIQPDWVICALGGNDVTRVGPEPTRTQVAPAESFANLQDLRRIAAARTEASWVWLTPVPVHEERVGSYRPFRFGESTWANADIVALAEAMSTFTDPVIDLVAAFGIPADPRLQGPDGVHPSLDGQVAITASLVDGLTTTAHHSAHTSRRRQRWPTTPLRPRP